MRRVGGRVRRARVRGCVLGCVRAHRRDVVRPFTGRRVHPHRLGRSVQRTDVCHPASQEEKRERRREQQGDRAGGGGSTHDRNLCPRPLRCTRRVHGALLPPGFEVQQIGRDFVPGVERDSLGIQRVVEYAYELR